MPTEDQRRLGAFAAHAYAAVGDIAVRFLAGEVGLLGERPDVDTPVIHPVSQRCQLVGAHCWASCSPVVPRRWGS
ncbi:hypothetical protein [Saccharopolyspora phatthalungensis]|uniref:Uncharacterized protein n=1 Tax=Saccharopolyspora phatthalungensis TaxID=664693 RepID=A0A840Q4H0_9PSEU|nr:hypothetical protein [Saccharopolyspora phatthalungensis]MBB5154877.1 hypothetical protein [Saccharopolyspora phatthalungensis]